MGEMTMPNYQFFRLDIGGRISLGRSMICLNDGDALDVALRLTALSDRVDVWDGIRHVGPAPVGARQ
jgi:hypothetical protein